MYEVAESSFFVIFCAIPGKGIISHMHRMPPKAVLSQAVKSGGGGGAQHLSLINHFHNSSRGSLVLPSAGGGARITAASLVVHLRGAPKRLRGNGQNEPMLLWESPSRSTAKASPPLAFGLGRKAGCARARTESSR